MNIQFQSDVDRLHSDVMFFATRSAVLVPSEGIEDAPTTIAGAIVVYQEATAIIDAYNGAREAAMQLILDVMIATGQKKCFTSAGIVSVTPTLRIITGE